MSIRTLLLTAAIATFLPLAAQAATDPGSATDRPTVHRTTRSTSYLAFLKDADLSFEQSDQLHQLFRANSSKLQPMRQQLRGVLAEIADRLSGTGAVDAAQLTSLQAQAATIRQQIDAQWLNAAVAARALLTPEQLAKVSEAHIEKASLRKPVTDAPEAAAKP